MLNQGKTKKVSEMKKVLVGDLEMSDNNLVLFFKDKILPRQWSCKTKDVGFDLNSSEVYKFPDENIVVANIVSNPNVEYSTLSILNLESSNNITVHIRKDYEVSVNTGEVVRLITNRINRILKKDIPRFTKKGYVGMTLGCDPEVFVVGGDNKLLPAFKFLPSEDKPMPTGSGGAFWDGFQAEFTSKASGCVEIFTNNVRSGLMAILNRAKTVDKDAKLSIKSVVDISDKLLQSTDPKYLEFGCSPSLNIYDGESSQVLLEGGSVNYRPAGGHLHFGMQVGNDKAIEKMVKSLDAILGVASVAMFRDMDDPRRRMLYGKAGEYRLPKHGLEYRVLSNAWLCHPLVTHLILDLARNAVIASKSGVFDLWQHDEEETQSIINNCDHVSARKVLTKNKKIMTGMLRSVENEKASADFRYKMFHRGVHHYIKDINDFHNNWNMGTDMSWSTLCRTENKQWKYAKDNFLTSTGKIIKDAKIA